MLLSLSLLSDDVIFVHNLVWSWASPYMRLRQNKSHKINVGDNALGFYISASPSFSSTQAMEVLYVIKGFRFLFLYSQIS